VRLKEKRLISNHTPGARNSLLLRNDDGVLGSNWKWKGANMQGFGERHEDTAPDLPGPQEANLAWCGRIGAGRSILKDARAANTGTRTD